MRVATSIGLPREIVYPESDGQPMADNTEQFEYIVTIKGGLEAQFRDDPLVFVAGDLLWYPVEGDPTIRAAPDVMVAFGRPKKRRGSYLQWLEDHVAPQVVFEIWSPGNRPTEMARKFTFYQEHGVEEYYLFNPDGGELLGWLRKGDRLEEIPRMNGWISPRLQVRFEVVDGRIVLHHPNSERFKTFVETTEEAARERQRADDESQRAALERRRAEHERQRAERLAAQLKAHGIEPEA